MDFRQMEAFIHVIQHGSFSKAADALFLTQPTISMHVSALEKELGRQLCLRQGKEVLPTKEGELLYQYAVAMMNIREKAVLSLRDYAQTAEGVLELQASSIPGEYILPNLLASFKRQHPKVRFFLEQSDSAQACENIAAHRGELGFVGNKSHPGLRYELLLTDEPILITPASEKFLKKQGQTLFLHDIAEEPFVLREQGSGTREVLEEQLKKAEIDIKKLNIAAKMNSIEAIKQAVVCGLGVSIISKIAAGERGDKEKFLSFSIGDYGLPREFYLTYDPRVPLSPAAVLFKEHVRQRVVEEIRQ